MAASPGTPTTRAVRRASRGRAPGVPDGALAAARKGHDGRRRGAHRGGRMAEIRPGRYGAEIDGDFVVFLIGPRLNKPRYVLQSIRDLGGRRRGMRAMLTALMADPSKGLLAYRMGFPT